MVFIDRLDTAYLLGREWIAEFNLLTVQQATPQLLKPQVAQQTSPNLENHLEEFKDLFDNSNLPPIQGFKAHLHSNLMLNTGSSKRGLCLSLSGQKSKRS